MHQIQTMILINSIIVRLYMAMVVYDTARRKKHTNKEKKKGTPTPTPTKVIHTNQACYTHCCYIPQTNQSYTLTSSSSSSSL